MKRRNFTKGFKAKVAEEATLGQRTVNELAQEFKVHVNQINLWKKQLVGYGTGGIQLWQGPGCLSAWSLERDRLYSKAGQLQVEVDWLKKKTGLPG